LSDNDNISEWNKNGLDYDTTTTRNFLIQYKSLFLSEILTTFTKW
jgi:hypothetical protein